MACVAPLVDVTVVELLVLVLLVVVPDVFDAVERALLHGVRPPCRRAMRRRSPRSRCEPCGHRWLGAGILVALPAKGVCGLVEAARIADYLARENAGQCHR